MYQIHIQLTRHVLETSGLALEGQGGPVGHEFHQAIKQLDGDDILAAERSATSRAGDSNGLLHGTPPWEIRTSLSLLTFRSPYLYGVMSDPDTHGGALRRVPALPLAPARRLAAALLLATVLPGASTTTAHAAYDWSGDLAGSGNRAIVRVYLANPPAHPSYTGYAHVTARPETDLRGVVLRSYYSIDDGVTWNALGDIVRDGSFSARLDMPHFSQVGTTPTLYVAIEHHTKPSDPKPANRTYRIEVHRSTDGGRTWALDSTVASQSNTVRGFWAPHLFRRPGDDQLQCYFDDEVYPATVGRDGQQCLRRKTYVAASRTWIDPVVVAFQDGMSRDGMPTVAALGGSGAGARLLCVFESPADDPPANPTRVMQVVSTDGGVTWGQRGVVYRPLRHGYHALAPWLATDWDGRLVVAFSTDEDRYPAPPGDNSDASTLHTDVKYVMSDVPVSPGSETRWSAAGYVARFADLGGSNLLWPGLERSRGPGAGLVSQFYRLGVDTRVRQGRPAHGPLEASPPDAAPLVLSRNAGGTLRIDWAPACGATDHVAYRGMTPIGGALAWTAATCGLGTTGSAEIDPGTPPPGQSIYVVIVGRTDLAEGSYGRDSAAGERPFAAGLGACGRPQDLVGSCP